MSSTSENPVTVTKKPSWSLVKICTYIFGVPFLVIWEAVGKSKDVIRPTVIINFVTKNLITVARFTGYYLAKLSDLFGFIRNLIDRIMDLLHPYIRAFVDAASDIAHETAGIVIEPTINFLDSYSEALDGVYNVLFTVLVSAGYIFGGSFVVSVGLECIGMVNGTTWIRPSTYINMFGKWLYREANFISATYLGMCDLVSYVQKFYERYRKYLEPYVKRIESAMSVIGNATQKMIIAPFKGLVDGATAALNGMQTMSRPIACLVAGSIFVGGTYLFRYWYKHD